jgi:hypothetical protein
LAEHGGHRQGHRVEAFLDESDVDRHLA